MIYTPMTNLATRVMYKAHKDQVDKNGLPYVFHPWHVAESMTDEVRCTVALLHDVVEDTKVTLDDLAILGFPEEVINAVKALTHRDDMDYAEYIRTIAENDIAIDVKIADLRHNMDKTRLPEDKQLPKIKYELYQSSLDYLLRVKEEKERPRIIK